MKFLVFLTVLLSCAISYGLDTIHVDNLVVTESVDLIETNHFYDDEGRLVFDQAIFYQWESYPDNRYQVIAWRLIKHNNQLPTYNYQTNRYECIWMDGHTLRRVRSKQVRETWTQHDPEILEREHFPKEHRRNLIKPRIKEPLLEKNPFGFLNKAVDGIVIFKGTLVELKKTW